jgi:hypothetical protein
MGAASGRHTGGCSKGSNCVRKMVCAAPQHHSTSNACKASPHREHRNFKRPRQGLGRPWDPGAGPDAVVAAAWSVRVGCRCPRLGRVRQARDASQGRVAASTSGLSLRRATSRCRGAHCCPGCAWCCSLGRCVCDGRAGAAQAGKSCPASRARPRGGGCGSIPR